ncbi:type VI secretion system tip protein VgrG, partial [Marinomonas primoryensis]
TDIIDGNLQQKVGSKAILDAANEIHLKSGNKVVIEAGAEITLLAGGSFIKIDAAGVSVVGGVIKLNSGGSAGAGSGFSGAVALLPKGEKSIAPPEKIVITPTPALKQQLISDQQQDEPVTEVCQKKADGTCPLTDCPCGNN